MKNLTYQTKYVTVELRWKDMIKDALKATFEGIGWLLKKAIEVSTDVQLNVEVETTHTTIEQGVKELPQLEASQTKKVDFVESEDTTVDQEDQKVEKPKVKNAKVKVTIDDKPKVEKPKKVETLKDNDGVPYELIQVNENMKQADLRKLWLTYSRDYNQLVKDKQIELTKNTPVKTKKGKTYKRTGKQDYINALLLLNAAIRDNAKQQLKQVEAV